MNTKEDVSGYYELWYIVCGACLPNCRICNTMRSVILALPTWSDIMLIFVGSKIVQNNKDRAVFRAI